MLGLIITIAAVVLGIFIALQMPRRRPVGAAPNLIESVLEQKVAYYNRLAPEEQQRFKEEVKAFLEKVVITGVKTDVSEEDKILVAASGVIPIFSFNDWKYSNLHEVLLYPQMFNEDFNLTPGNDDKHVLGMVGNGAMNNVMVLSKPALEAGFSNHTDKHNTAIHEFVHLIDKTDGSVDGVPEILAGKQYAKPWLQMIHRQIAAIKNNDSDINPYGATNEAEFLAVASEYFFERPLLLKEKHPELYALLEKLFRQEPKTDSKTQTTTLNPEA